jgi:hypothetical protein
MVGRGITLRSASGDPGRCVVDAEGTSVVDGRVLRCSNGGVLGQTVEGLTLTGGFTEQGGGILGGGADELTIRNCHIIGNVATNGGGLYVGGPTIIDGCHIAENVAADGGGLLVDDGSVLVIGSTIASNAADAGGGIMVRRDGHVEVIGGRLIGNVSGSLGGAAYATNASLTIRDAVIAGNEAELIGGGIASQEALTQIFGSTIVGNRASAGGGVSHRETQVTRIERSIVWFNCAPTDPDLHIRAGGVMFLACAAVDTAGMSDLGDGIFADADTIFDDPRFCVLPSCEFGGIPTVTLNGASPCLPGASPCGSLIGAMGADCGTVSVGAAEWVPPPNLRFAPNPFTDTVRGTTTANAVAVFDVTGRRVQTLAVHDGTFVWNGRRGDGVPVAPGVYFLKADGSVQTIIFTR